jgi:hypothetical protein
VNNFFFKVLSADDYMLGCTACWVIWELAAWKTWGVFYTKVLCNTGFTVEYRVYCVESVSLVLVCIPTFQHCTNYMVTGDYFPDTPLTHNFQVHYLARHQPHLPPAVLRE